MKIKLMTHMIAGYPDKDTDYDIAKALIDGGASSLEVQFPFSDPSADGPLIEKASSDAIEKGFRVDDGFSLVKRIKKYSDVPVFIMTYASIAYAKGIRDFAEKSSLCGAAGLIIPDLPFDSDEGLFSIAEENNLAPVPVVVPGIKKERLEKILALGTDYIYAAMRSGITGKETSLDDSNIKYLELIRAMGKKGLIIMAGFGIRRKEQIKMLENYADCAIVGSGIVEKINSRGTLTVYDSVYQYTKSLHD